MGCRTRTLSLRHIGRHLSEANIADTRLHHACTDANLLTMAQNQARDAYAAGHQHFHHLLFRRYGRSAASSYAASLARLRKGVGVSLVAPTAATITTVLGGFCSTMASALKLVN